MRRLLRRVLRSLLPWMLLACVLWLGQLWYIGHTTSGWGSYWTWRGWYRPGIQVVQAHGADYLPGHTFHPLSPTGARLAFALAAGVYAIVGATALWLVWRANRTRRARFVGRLTRPTPRRGVRRRAA